MSLSRSLRPPVSALRRVLAPAALELEGELPQLRAEVERLAAENAALRQAVAEVQEDLRRTTDRLVDGERRVAELTDGLHEARRLNLRIAELTDVVTELVLPLHRREVDPAVLSRLSPDTL